MGRHLALLTLHFLCQQHSLLLELLLFEDVRACLDTNHRLLVLSLGVVQGEHKTRYLLPCVLVLFVIHLKAQFSAISCINTSFGTARLARFPFFRRYCHRRHMLGLSCRDFVCNRRHFLVCLPNKVFYSSVQQRLTIRKCVVEHRPANSNATRRVSLPRPRRLERLVVQFCEPRSELVFKRLFFRHQPRQILGVHLFGACHIFRVTVHYRNPRGL
mmetsp:Transcript_14011/g.22970  ORF Transcript_14011/g.22970 Transcript_14011/m.22970 type:complete len:215 (-) Transcript_14011:1378-2022(-)